MRLRQEQLRAVGGNKARVVFYEVQSFFTGDKIEYR
jgi:hypothetical protein